MSGAPPVPALLCDRMLIRLGRWLRAAGYDTAIQTESISDRDLLERAVRERRRLVTRDRKLSEFRAAPGTVILLGANRLADCARELSERLDVDWLHRPFSRCLLCNAALVEAPAEARAALPAGARELAEAATWCPACAHLFWPGSHARRMQARLEAWSRGEF